MSRSVVFLKILISVADLNFVSNIVSNCFLMTYTLVNYATFDASYSKAPGIYPNFSQFFPDFFDTLPWCGFIFVLTFKDFLMWFWLLFSSSFLILLTGWRPTFKYYDKWLSLATASTCFVIMFCLDWVSGLIVAVLVGESVLFFFLNRYVFLTEFRIRKKLLLCHAQWHNVHAFFLHRFQWFSGCTFTTKARKSTGALLARPNLTSQR